MNYICHSGGCPGSDMFWENEGNKCGVKTIAYSFYNHVQESANRNVLTVEELNEGFEHVLIASKGLKRKPDTRYNYVKNLLSRNWFQVKNSEAVFAIGKFLNNKTVSGGTGWAVQMAIDNNKPVFMFDQIFNYWSIYVYDVKEFRQYYVIPKLTENFAGIGTRELNENGKIAIREIYKENITLH
jgi:hypothetical protein